MKNSVHHTSSPELSALQRDFINCFQGGVPLHERPFMIMAEQLGCTEDTLIKTVNELKTNNILSRFGPLFDAAEIGGGLTLAAISVAEERFDEVTEMVNSFAEVAHNYRRDHALNMWFVVATETPRHIDHVLHSIEQLTALKVYNFPKQQEFYIGLWLNIFSDGTVSTIPVQNQTVKRASSRRIDAIDKKLIRATQTGLPIEKTPYLSVADKLGLSQQETLQRFQSMLRTGRIRRVGAVPNHYRLGLLANGMTVWDVAENDLLEMGNLIGQLGFVSHCYQRPRHLPIWPYNLFAMVHGHNKTEVADKVLQIERLLGDRCRSHETLYSSAILKKTGMRLAA